MNTASLHSYAGANRVNPVIIGFYSYFCPLTRITNNFLNDDKSIENLRHFYLQ